MAPPLASTSSAPPPPRPPPPGLFQEPEFPSVSSGSAPPSSAAGFDADPRVYFSGVSGKWSFEADDGEEMEWDVVRNSWVPILDEDVLAQQQAAYSVEGVDESAPVAAVAAREAAKKRKEAGGDDATTSKKKPKKEPKAARQTAIYITHLPERTTAAQIESVFSKAGLILEDADGNKRIKLYYHDDGRFKGEALVVYLKEESVKLAVTLMDETELVLGSGEGNMRVKKAEWEKKEGGGEGAASNGAERKTDGNVEASGSGSGAGKGRPGNGDAQKQKTARRAEKLLQKLTDWDSDEESTEAIAARARNAKIVVLEGLFTLKELDEDATLLLDLKEDVREECETLGEVTNVTLYDMEEAGILTVRFKDDLAAQACIAKMHGRFFGGRSISAYNPDGTKKYKKSNRAEGAGGAEAGGGSGGGGDAEAKEKERLENYARWLEEDKGEQ